MCSVEKCPGFLWLLALQGLDDHRNREAMCCWRSAYCRQSAAQNTAQQTHAPSRTDWRNNKNPGRAGAYAKPRDSCVVVPEARVARGQDAKLRRCAEGRKNRNGNNPRCGDEDVLENTIFLPGRPTTGHAQSAIFLSFSSTCRSTCLGSGGRGRCRPRCSRPRFR